MVLDYGKYVLLIFPLIWIDFSLINFLFSIISIHLAAMTKEHNILLNENKIVRDKLKEDTLFAKYNERLRIDREKNIQIAILTENRIARELHDSIGHGISSSILQVEA